MILNAVVTYTTATLKPVTVIVIRSMEHLIDGKKVNINWEQVEVIDNHGSGCTDWIIYGEDENGVEYYADGNYQDDELIEVSEIESL